MKRFLALLLINVIIITITGCQDDIEATGEVYMHISIDDTIDVFEDLTKNVDDYNSIFDNNTLNFFKTMHDKYGAKFSMYCFYKNGEFDLSKATNKFSNEFKQNSDWLKFGFHTIDGESNYENTSKEKAKDDYEKVVTQLIRITGSDDCLDTIPRLQNFAGNKESILSMKNSSNGIEGVLSADDNRLSYYLDKENSDYILTHDKYEDEANQIEFISTDLRLENFDNPYKELENRINNKDYSNSMSILEIFTHEVYLNDSNMKNKIKDCCKFAKKYGYVFDYAMNR